MIDLHDFDRYCDEHNVADEDLPAAFANYLAAISGEAVLGGPVGEPPEVVAVPEDDHASS